MKKVLNILKFIIEKLCIFMMGSLAILIILSVILRYVFNISFIWAEEFITMLFIATTYYGIIIGTIEDQHIKIDFIHEIAPTVVKKILYTLSSVIVVSIQVLIIKYSVMWINQVGYQKTPGMQIPYKFFYIMMPISCGFVALFEVVKLINELMNKQEVKA
ncbi:TRAP transporter small permease [Clostridium sp. DL1XJH146]